MTSRSGPLEDLTIIDCTMAYAGPFGTTLLADLGANVIKVEPPSGDTFRNVPPFPPDHAMVGSAAPAGADYGAPFASVNRNKRSIVLDFKEAADRHVLLALAERADAIVENMRAGVMDELGLGYEAIATRNPRIVYGAATGIRAPGQARMPTGRASIRPVRPRAVSSRPRVTCSASRLPTSIRVR